MTQINNLYHPKLSYQLTGHLFKIHNELERYKTERQYCDAFEKILKDENIQYYREVELNKIFENISQNGNIPDFVIERKIIIDFKAKKFITKEDYFQMLRYLDIANLPLGLIVNFRLTYLKPKRVVNSKFKNKELESFECN